MGWQCATLRGASGRPDLPWAVLCGIRAREGCGLRRAHLLAVLRSSPLVESHCCLHAIPPAPGWHRGRSASGWESGGGFVCSPKPIAFGRESKMQRHVRLSECVDLRQTRSCAIHMPAHPCLPRATRTATAVYRKARCSWRLRVRATDLCADAWRQRAQQRSRRGVALSVQVWAG